MLEDTLIWLFVFENISPINALSENVAGMSCKHLIIKIPIYTLCILVSSMNFKFSLSYKLLLLHVCCHYDILRTNYKGILYSILCLHFSKGSDYSGKITKLSAWNMSRQHPKIIVVQVYVVENS